MRGPNANALYLRQVLDDFFVRQFVQSRKVEQPSRRLDRQVFQICRLLLRQANASQLLITEFENALGSKRLARERREALENGHRRLAVQLLVDNRLGHTAKLWYAILHAARAHALDNGAQDGIALFQMVHSLSHNLYI